MRWIANIIKKYNLERIPVFGYSVRILQYYKDLPIISIEGSEVVDKCPGCGAGTNIARYLRTEKENLHGDHDIASVTCLECGCVYRVSAPNGRLQADYQ
jgi:RNase P subunit RPR2